MRRKLLIGCLGFCGVLAAAAVITFFVLDARLGLLQAPRTRYSDAAGLEWPVRILIEPQAISEALVGLIKKSSPQLPAAISNPRVLAEILPQEIAILMQPDAITGQLTLTAFANENRFGPVLQPILKEIPASMTNIQWAPEGLLYPKRGTFLVHGKQALDPLAIQFFDQQWTRSGYQAPLQTTGGHFIEILLDNRNGAAMLFTLMGIAASDPAMLQPLPEGQEHQAPDQRAMMPFIVNSLKKVDAVSLFADPGENDTLVVQLNVTCDPAAERAGPETVKTVLDTGLGQLQEQLQALYGIQLQGKTRIQGTNLVGDYTAEPFSRILSLYIQ